MNAEIFIKKITKEAGEAVWKRFGKDGAHYMKSKNRFDVVTKADLMAEKFIVSAIRKNFPSHGIIAEESGRMNEDAEYVWIIDPIDGTDNFSRGIPMFGVMVAFARNKKIVHSAIYLPVTKELFSASIGKGAYKNGKRIHCARESKLGRSYGCGSSGIYGKHLRFLKRLLAAVGMKQTMHGSFGSMAVNACYTADGRRDWMVAVFGGLHDFAAPALLLKEAGCTVTNTKGKPWTMNDLEIVAANPTLHRQLIKLTKGV